MTDERRGRDEGSHTQGDAPAASRCVARLIGCDAMRALEDGARGTVSAVFDRGVYVALDEVEISGPRRLVFAGGEDTVAGPLVVRTSRSDWQGIALGDRVRLKHDDLCIGERVTVDLRDAQTWSPPSFPGVVPVRLARGLEALGAIAAPWPSTATERAGQRLVDLLGDVTATVQAGDAQFAKAAWPEAMRGLGAGLTPSGDDMLVGILIALHAVQQRHRLEALIARIKHGLDDATTPISAAHLRAAMGGAAVEPLHQVVNAVLAGAPERTALAQGVAALTAVGHSSGRDALAGLLAALRATRPTEC